MDPNMVLSYNYAKQYRRRRHTNAPPLRAISMAMVRRWSDTFGFTRCSMSRANRKPLDATIGRLLAPYCLGRQPEQQQTKRGCKCVHCWPFWWPLQCTCNIPRASPFTKATKHRHRVSTHSNIKKGTHQLRLFRTFHREKELKLTCWPLLTMGLWHIKLMRST